MDRRGIYGVVGGRKESVVYFSVACLAWLRNVSDEWDRIGGNPFWGHKHVPIAGPLAGASTALVAFQEFVRFRVALLGVSMGLWVSSEQFALESAL